MRNPSVPLHFQAFACLLLMAPLAGRANNIQVTNTTLTNNTGTTAQVQFDLSWENSWRGGGVSNWDAAWVFVKFRTPQGNWQHVRLNNTGHVAAAGSQIELGLLTPGAAYNAATNPVVGTFIHRNAAGYGNLSLPATQLQWNYAALGLAYNDIAEIRVMAIEVVNVPEGAFFVGSGGTEACRFKDGPTNNPYQITSEGTIPMGNTAGQLWADCFIQSGTAPAAFPKGYRSFYMMKYELSQQGYVDFLNMLTRTQQNARTAANLAPGVTSPGANVYVMRNSPTTGNENGIRAPASFDANAPIVFFCDMNGNGAGGDADDGTDLPADHLTPRDIQAYLDWSGLRPMTELEYEKACRGGLPPSVAEYAWGNYLHAAPNLTFNNRFQPTETINTGYSTVAGNAALYNGTNSPRTRCGVFADHALNTGRMTAGASYHGIMDLTGSVAEPIISMFWSGASFSYSSWFNFTGGHGDGALGTDGETNVPDWPWTLAGHGLGFRGGAIAPWDIPSGPAMAGYGQVSERRETEGWVNGRFNLFGCRGVRTAP